MLTAALTSRRYGVAALIVSVASLIPSLKPRLQLEQANPGDRSGDEEARHRNWSHLDLLRWSHGTPGGLLAP